MARILIVDDDTELLKIARALLASQGHDVHVALNADLALNVINQISLDLVITDVNMPDHSGFDLIRTLKARAQHSKSKDGKNHHVSVAMLTGRREKVDIEHALKLGVVDYILKPLDPPLFLQKIDDLITRNQPFIQPTELRLATTNVTAQALIPVPVDLISISETGLSIETPLRLKEDSFLKLDLKLFVEIGIEAPRLKVLSCLAKSAGANAPTGTAQNLSQYLSDDRYIVRVAFVGINENSLQKIRAWTYKTMARVNGRSA